jgi:hypothetical protein
MILAWVIDIYLNFLEFADRKRFYQDIVATKSNAVLISSDIADNSKQNTKAMSNRYTIQK